MIVDMGPNCLSTLLLFPPRRTWFDKARGREAGVSHSACMTSTEHVQCAREGYSCPQPTALRPRKQSVSAISRYLGQWLELEGLALSLLDISIGAVHRTDNYDK